MKLIKITDNGGETLDRYTAYFTDDMMLMMSHNALSPQGVCLSDTCKPEYIAADKGRTVRLTQLPEGVQTAILRFMTT